ncbi:MAG: DUF1266 domain-containing protein [Defluviitaleaceae bacterium]|nr:DUF1266 domain-containing protein [Defluviitaleaceae bacterium]MCL2273342.1 DUF1266 domain-containing protein [Defluviitaleaceae bacterium]
MSKLIIKLTFTAWAVAFIFAVVIISFFMLPDFSADGALTLGHGATFAILGAFIFAMAGFGISNTLALRNYENRHVLSKEKQGLLAFAEPLQLAHGESFRTFRLLSIAKKEARVMLTAEGWNISDEKNAKDALERLSTASECVACSAENATKIPAYRATREYLLQTGFPQEMLDNLQSYAAYDYGRTAFIARLCARVKFISEEDAWRFVECAANNARQLYNNWHEYIAAYVLGRALALGEFTPWTFEHRKGSPFLLFPFK